MSIACEAAEGVDADSNDVSTDWPRVCRVHGPAVCLRRANHGRGSRVRSNTVLYSKTEESTGKRRYDPHTENSPALSPCLLSFSPCNSWLSADSHRVLLGAEVMSSAYE